MRAHPVHKVSRSPPAQRGARALSHVQPRNLLLLWRKYQLCARRRGRRDARAAGLGVREVLRGGGGSRDDVGREARRGAVRPPRRGPPRASADIDHPPSVPRSGPLRAGGAARDGHGIHHPGALPHGPRPHRRAVPILCPAQEEPGHDAGSRVRRGQRVGRFCARRLHLGSQRRRRRARDPGDRRAGARQQLLCCVL